MNIHEYQAKELYRQYGVPTPNGFPAFSPAEAVEAAKRPVSYTHLTLPTIYSV